MTDLAEVQRLLTSSIDGASGTDDTARLHQLLATGGSFGPERRVAVYRYSSRRARESALEAIYPVCKQVLGNRCFAGLADRYTAAFPSKAGDLNVYGAGFPEHLESWGGAQEALLYISGLARLEWHWHAVYYAPNDPHFDSTGFSALAAGGRVEQAQFRLSAGLRLLASAYPVHEIWQRHRDGSDTSAVAMGGGDLLVILRVGYRPQVVAVESDTFKLLSALEQGKTLGAAAADGLAVEQIPGLIEERWIVGFGVVASPSGSVGRATAPSQRSLGQ